VFVEHLRTSFDMSGGSITGNTATGTGNIARDVYLQANAYGAAFMSMSGNAQIGNLALHAVVTTSPNANRSFITISSNNFTGSVGSLDLMTNNIDVLNWNYWVRHTILPSGTPEITPIPVIRADGNVILTPAMVYKFGLRDFVNSNGTKRIATTSAAYAVGEYILKDFKLDNMSGNLKGEVTKPESQ